MSNGHLRKASSDPLYVWFYDGVFGVGGSNGAISGMTKSKMAAVILENSNGDISAMDHPIYSVFGLRLRFLGSPDRIALFRVGPNSIGRPYVGENKCARTPRSN